MYLRIKLLSDGSFGRGDGVAGVVDSEIEHDSATGLPIIKGRTIKGLMVEACADIMFSLSKSNSAAQQSFAIAADTLFGSPGSTQKSSGILRFHTATLPSDFVERIRLAGYNRHQVLDALTSIRNQTAVDPLTETPMGQSLRSIRVLLRGMIFHGPLSTDFALKPDELSLLAACAATVRHGGMNRTRGLGNICLTLEDTGGSPHDDLLNDFAHTITTNVEAE